MDSEDLEGLDAEALRREVVELRAEAVRLERELGVERGARAAAQAQALQETLRANAGWIARDRLATSTAYRVGRIFTAPAVALRRQAGRVRRALTRDRHPSA